MLKKILSRQQRALLRTIRRKLRSPLIWRHSHFVATKLDNRENSYLTWLLGLMYQHHFLKDGEGIELKPYMFHIVDCEDYIERWYKILTVDTAPIIHFNLDVNNLILPKHQSPQQIATYYAFGQAIFVARYLQYPLTNPTYLDVIPQPYGFAYDNLEKIRYCELGPGIPHGLFFQAFTHGETFADKIESIEIFDYPLIYRDITENLLRGIFPNAEIVLQDGHPTNPPTPTTKPNFIVGKDVFEHVHNPDQVLARLLENMAVNAIVAVDIINRSPEDYQHVALELSHLEELIIKRGFTFKHDTSRVKIYTR